MIRDWRRRHP